MNRRGAAIASLILGILSILFPFLGLILGIIGIVYSRKVLKLPKEEDDYKGMAKGGMICSVIGVCLQVFFILSALLGIVLFMNVA
ncbi:DUF4190 domain-containing protein [Halobacillus sp. A5]|uniref:DUF4190 domain-containing protein n=1 Tax=Halobacillus sp. A5 TaxID=2880263 RepID=UPI0020A62DBA|nr:DUF4190 domain-containing protein [Halobacillus sp. A5]MCP3029107.1 DUF4190 domain-containing protein [Halobacillus sp. A5]